MSERDFSFAITPHNLYWRFCFLPEIITLLQDKITQFIRIKRVTANIKHSDVVMKFKFDIHGKNITIDGGMPHTFLNTYKLNFSVQLRSSY